MKKILFVLTTMLFVVLVSCKKESFSPAHLATFTVVNVINNGSAVKADFTGKEDVFATTVAETEYSRFRKYAVPAGPSVPITIVSSIYPEDILFRQSMIFQPGDIYSLFLAGEAGAIDTIMVKDDVTTPPDNTIRIRFINCSPGGSFKIVPIKMDYDNVSTPQSAVLDLGYKQYTDFISFPAEGSLNTYKIEVRDPVTDELLITSQIPRIVTNITIIIRGYVGGNPSLGLLRMRQDT